MDRRAASEHLEVIRTLMERSAVYRRALGPTMMMLGILGIAAGVTGYYLNIIGRGSFAFFWMGVGVTGLAGAYLQMRGQALREREPFWSPPTKRVTQALAPALFVGALLGLASANAPILKHFKQPLLLEGEPNWLLPAIWMLLYGCAVHAAGFFMPRGFKLFGWSYILAGCFVWLVLARLESVSLRWAHLLMGVAFGGPHLAYGVYLAITGEKKGGGLKTTTLPSLQLDRVIHEKGRMAIMSLLAASPELSFTEMRDTLSMTDGNLSVHLKTLQETGYVAVTKSYQDRKPLTTCTLTKSGRTAFTTYINLLEQIVRQARGE